MPLPLPINMLLPAQMEKIGAAPRLLILLQRFLSRGNKNQKHKPPLVTAAECLENPETSQNCSEFKIPQGNGPCSITPEGVEHTQKYRHRKSCGGEGIHARAAGQGEMQGHGEPPRAAPERPASGACAFLRRAGPAPAARDESCPRSLETANKLSIAVCALPQQPRCSSVTGS